MASSVKQRQVVYKKKHMYKDRKETTHVRQRWRKHTSSYIYIYIYIKEYNVCNKSGHKTMVHVMRKNTSKPHYIPQKHSKLRSPYLVGPMLALPLTPRLLSSTKLLLLFVTSDKGCITETSSSHHHTDRKSVV